MSWSVYLYVCISVSVRPYKYLNANAHINPYQYSNKLKCEVEGGRMCLKMVGDGKWCQLWYDMYDTHVVCKPQNLFKTLLESIPRLLEFFSSMPSWHSPRCREVHGQGVVGRFHWQLGLLLRGTPQEEVFMVAFRFLMSSMQKQRTATPGPQGQARTHTTGNVGNALAMFFDQAARICVCCPSPLKYSWNVRRIANTMIWNTFKFLQLAKHWDRWAACQCHGSKVLRVCNP